MEGSRLLVVDDEQDLVRVVRTNLEQAGFGVRTAADGVEALGRLREERPDLLLLDVMMPNLDGWGVLAHLDADGHGDLPVIMLTALSDEQDVIRAHLSGAVHFLTKPFDLDALLESIRDALQPRSEEQVLDRQRQLRGFVQRLAELDAGREAAPGPRVSLSRLESPPRPANHDQGQALVATLTARQRQIAQLFAAGVHARTIAEQLGTSRSNVYATRKRIAVHLGVDPDEVASAVRTYGLKA
ncbi:MAG: response regulator [Egicoccus sp.]